MNADPFLDSNLLLYLLSAEPEKADRAEALLAAGGTVSVQVLNEFAAVARRKAHLDFAEIRVALGVVRSTCAVVPLDLETHALGLDVAERYRFSVYDGLIVAAALRAGCTVLYSEDLQHGQTIDGLTIRSPFS